MPPDVGSVIVSALGIGEGFPAAWAAARALRKGSHAATHPGAELAYIAYQSACTELLFHLQTIAEIGVPPSIVGGLWTWPPVIRAHRGLLEAASKAAVAFDKIIMLGSQDVAQAAFELGIALGAASSGLEVRQRKISSTPEFRGKVRVASDALRVYLLAVRAELQLPAPPPPEPEDGGRQPD